MVNNPFWISTWPASAADSVTRLTAMHHASSTGAHPGVLEMEFHHAAASTCVHAPADLHFTRACSRLVTLGKRLSGSLARQRCTILAKSSGNAGLRLSNDGAGSLICAANV